MSEDYKGSELTQKKHKLKDLYPQDIEQLRHQLMGQMAGVLEGQTRTRIFASSISKLINREHSELLSKLEKCIDRINDPIVLELLDDAIMGCKCLDSAFDSLVDERQKQWQKNSIYLHDIIEEFNQTSTYLSSVLVEKDLFERQSQVLESIILSHEKISQWKEFVQEILTGFHSIFPFNFFFIAFAEEHGLSLYFYYLHEYSEEEKKKIKEMMQQRLLSELNISRDAAIDIEEFYINCNGKKRIIEDLDLITVSVPDHAPGLAGLLGVAFASATSLTMQEQTIVRSLLSVMVMVVGSSKVLSRTLNELEYYSVHDPLTGIHNRRYFNEMLEYEVARSERHKHGFSILQLDLDDFKDINDSYGHPIGDNVLIKIAETIQNNLRKGDVLVRMGGDEFTIILPETSPSGAKIAAETVKDSLQKLSFDAAQGKTFHITTSIGVISYPKDAQTFEDLMVGVDRSLYRAKDLGKNEVVEFDAELSDMQTLRDSRGFVEVLRQALKEERILPYFQPIIDCHTGEVFAYESVARLQQQNGTTMAAGQFIETIEKYGLARDMDRIIVQKVITANKQFMENNCKPKRLFINLSPQEIQGRGVLGYAEELCKLYQVPPSSIVFEILERDAIGDLAHMGRFLKNLRQKGFSFALDDFGSGYNSFHYLRELHFEYVKIDGAFICNIVNSKIDRALVANLSKLCQDLGILTIGEFVENEETFVVLKEMGIDYAQGFHLGMPEPF